MFTARRSCGTHATRDGMRATAMRRAPFVRQSHCVSLQSIGLKGYSMRHTQMNCSRFTSHYSRSSVRRLVVSLIGVAGLVLATFVCAPAFAASAANAQSPLAMNLLPVTYYTAEQPFLNIFKTTGVAKLITPVGWATSSGGTFNTGESAHLQLDAN